MEIVELIKVASPSVLGKVSDKRAASIIREALAVIADQLACTDVGTVNVTGLGRFVVKNLDDERNEVGGAGRRIVLRAAKAKGKTAGVEAV